MAQKVTVSLVDDVDGSEAEETVEFGLDGVTYQIDLSGSNAAKLRDALASFVANARRAGGRKRTPSARPTATKAAARPAATATIDRVGNRGRGRGGNRGIAAGTVVESPREKYGRGRATAPAVAAAVT